MIPSVSRIVVGCGNVTYGEIAIGSDDDPRFYGQAATLDRLWRSVTAQPLYRDLTASQALAMMAAKMRGPLWVSVVSDGSAI